MADWQLQHAVLLLFFHPVKRLHERFLRGAGLQPVGGTFEGDFAVGPLPVAVADQVGDPEREIEQVEGEEQQRRLLPQVHGFVPQLLFGEGCVVVEHHRKKDDGMKVPGWEAPCMDGDGSHRQPLCVG